MKTNKISISELSLFIESQNISITSISLYKESQTSIDYIVNFDYLVRLSEKPLPEEKILTILANYSSTPHILLSGYFNINSYNTYITIMDYIKGNELYQMIQNLDESEQFNVGNHLGHYLQQLHNIKDSYYDIGHYIPVIPRYKGSWKSGHIKYTDWIKENLFQFKYEDNIKAFLEKAIQYVYDHIDALDFQTGPVLLHNDLHPKNIIINQNHLSGIIDWECAQFGERDFELTHLFHWSEYPMEDGHNFPLLIKQVIKSYQAIYIIPNLDQRLTIYQIQHELFQMILHSGNVTKLRLQRIQGWLDGNISKLINSFQLAKI